MREYLRSLVDCTLDALGKFSVAGPVSFEVSFKDNDSGFNNVLKFSINPGSGDMADGNPSQSD